MDSTGRHHDALIGIAFVFASPMSWDAVFRILGEFNSDLWTYYTLS
jgi:hypothetical protein